MKKIILPLIALTVSSCAPFSGFSCTSGYSAGSYHARTADNMSEDGKRILFLDFKEYLESNIYCPAEEN